MMRKTTCNYVWSGMITNLMVVITLQYDEKSLFELEWSAAFPSFSQVSSDWIVDKSIIFPFCHLQCSVSSGDLVVKFDLSCNQKTVLWQDKAWNCSLWSDQVFARLSQSPLQSWQQNSQDSLVTELTFPSGITQSFTAAGTQIHSPVVGFLVAFP